MLEASPTRLRLLDGSIEIASHPRSYDRHQLSGTSLLRLDPWAAILLLAAVGAPESHICYLSGTLVLRVARFSVPTILRIYWVERTGYCGCSTRPPTHCLINALPSCSLSRVMSVILCTH